MRSFLLLIFSLMAGCEVRSAEEGCIKQWAEFTCNKTRRDQKTKNKETRFLWYSDEKRGHFMLLTEDLKQKEAGEYACKNDHDKLHAVKLELQSDKCSLKLFHQTACPSAKTTCNPKTHGTGSKGGSRPPYTNSGSKERIIYTDSSSRFNVTIRDVSLVDAGHYCCGLQSKDKALQSAQITLEFQKIRFFTRSLTVGQNFTYWCHEHHTADKFICKGEDPSACTPVDNRTFVLSDIKNKANITITVTHVTVQDAGTYWCGVDPERRKLLFHRFIMTVDAPSPEEPTTSPVPSAQTTTAPAANSHRGVLVMTAVIMCVVVLLLFVLILIFIYKRFPHSNTTRNGAPKTVREDNMYEELQGLRQKSDTGNVTASFSTNPSASLHYATINFHKAGGETPKPSSSGCEYSTVMFTKSPKTVIQPSPSTDDALYSTVNKPQLQQRNM